LAAYYISTTTWKNKIKPGIDSHDLNLQLPGFKNFKYSFLGEQYAYFSKLCILAAFDV